MLEWIDQYSGALNAIFNFGMVTIWLVYFNLVVAAYRRQRQTRLIINQVPRDDGTLDCQIVNMSPEPVFLDVVAASPRPDGEDNPVRLSSRRRGMEVSGDEEVVRFGTLFQGSSIGIGSFAEILDELGLSLRQGGECVLELTAVGIYGPEDLPVGARRRFRLYRDGAGVLKVEPLEAASRQIRAKKQRRALRPLVEQGLGTA